MNTILGMLLFAFGGLCGATYQVPSRGVRGWAFESWWFVYVVSALVIFPPIICALTVPDFLRIVADAPWAVKLRCAGFGAMWGVGAVCWGLMIRYLGFGLGLAIGCGIAAAGGTLIPPLATGHAADLVKDAGAVTVLAGVILSLAGIVLVGLAGKSKEGELSEEEKKRAVADFDFRKGVVVAIVAGVFSAGMNFGLQGGESIERAVVASGAAPMWRGMPVIMIVMWGGFVVQTAWCLTQNFRNRTFGDYRRPPARNYPIAMLMGFIWILQFASTKAGEPLMGELKYVSFAVLMASTIFFSTVIGIRFGEWKGTGRKTRALLTAGTAILVLSFCIMSIGSK